jgi:hypothetical protein
LFRNRAKNDSVAALSPAAANPADGTDQSVIPKDTEELSASKLTAPIRVNNTPGDIPAPCDSIIDRVDGDVGCYPPRYRIADNTFIPHVFHRAEVKLSFTGVMFRDVCEP